MMLYIDDEMDEMKKNITNIYFKSMSIIISLLPPPTPATDYVIYYLMTGYKLTVGSRLEAVVASNGSWI